MPASVGLTTTANRLSEAQPGKLSQSNWATAVGYRTSVDPDEKKRSWVLPCTKQRHVARRFTADLKRRHQTKALTIPTANVLEIFVKEQTPKLFEGKERIKFIILDMQALATANTCYYVSRLPKLEPRINLCYLFHISLCYSNRIIKIIIIIIIKFCHRCIKVLLLTRISLDGDSKKLVQSSTLNPNSMSLTRRLFLGFLSDFSSAS